MSHKINLNVDELNKGDIFDTFNGNYYNNLEFVKSTPEFVYAKWLDSKSETLKFKRIDVETNGTLSPMELEGEYAIGEPLYENRRPIRLKLAKRKLKDVNRDGYFLYFRKDKTTDLFILQSFGENDFNGNLSEYVYVIDDDDFINKENERVRILKLEIRKEQLKSDIEKTEKILNHLKKELIDLE